MLRGMTHLKVKSSPQNLHLNVDLKKCYFHENKKITPLRHRKGRRFFATGLPNYNVLVIC